MTVIATERLLLRPPMAADAAALCGGLGNLNVSKWTRRIPHPYALADAHEFLGLAHDGPDRLRRAITAGGTLIGVIGIEDGEIGYWIAEPHWGKGYGREAARAMADHAFTAMRLPRLVASYHLGNEASRRILAELGFRETGTATSFSKARNAAVEVMELVLTREDWAAARERRR